MPRRSKDKRPALGWPLLMREILKLSGLENYRLDAGVESAFVAAGGVLVQDALLNALVEDGDGGAVDLDKVLLVAGGEGLAHEAEGSAKLGLVGAVDGRLGNGLAAALEGRYVVCHGARSLFFSGWGKGMLGEAGAQRLVLNDGVVQRFLCISDSRGFAGLGQFL